MRNFQRLAYGVNVTPLLHQLYSQPWLWNQFKVRTHHPMSAHRVVDDIILRYNPYEKDEDFVEKVCSSISVENYPPFSALPEAYQLVFGLMGLVKGEHLGRCFISRMAPGAVIPPHTDVIEPAEELGKKPFPWQYYNRYHILLQSEPGAVFKCGDEQVQMLTGEIWWFDNELLHEVVNNSGTDRISLVCDIHTSDFTYSPDNPP